MSDLKRITTPGGVTYDLVDAGARELIDELSSYTDYLGVTTDALSDGATTNPISIVGKDTPVTAKKGNIAGYQSKEFIFNGTAWAEFGDLSGLGQLAFADNAQATYTPAGTVSQPTASVANTGTTNVNSITNVGTLPSATMPTFSVENETLVIGAGAFDPGTLPTKGDPVEVVTSVGDITVSQPTFSGTEATIVSTKAS